MTDTTRLADRTRLVEEMAQAMRLKLSENTLHVPTPESGCICPRCRDLLEVTVGLEWVPPSKRHPEWFRKPSRWRRLRSWLASEWNDCPLAVVAVAIGCAALWLGVHTVGCCCGHGREPGSILIRQDGEQIALTIPDRYGQTVLDRTHGKA